MEKFCLAWKDFAVNTTASIQELRRETELFDVTLACDDDHQLEAHKLVLASCSQVFKSILTKKRVQNQLIYLRGLSKQDLDYMVEYIYQGEVNVMQDQLQRFLQVATDFKLKGLTDVQDSDFNHLISADSNPVDKENDFSLTIDTEIPGYSKADMVPNTGVEVVPKNEVMSENQVKLPVKKEKKDLLRNNTPSTDPPPLVIYNAEEIKRYDNLVNSKMEKRGKYWYCLECGKEFMPRNKQCAFRHIDLNHMSSYSFVCNFCSKSFIAKSNLNYHIKNCKEVPKN